jgi:hypothetical protein
MVVCFLSTFLYMPLRHFSNQTHPTLFGIPVRSSSLKKSKRIQSGVDKLHPIYWSRRRPFGRDSRARELHAFPAAAVTFFFPLTCDCWSCVCATSACGSSQFSYISQRSAGRNFFTPTPCVRLRCGLWRSFHFF